MSPGLSVAHYRITAKLGEGGMGEVWRATDTKLDREVAIKILPETFAADPDRMARFEREAKVLASLNHPNIAAIHGVEERALVMELVPGPTLAERIAQGAIPLDEALGIAQQIAEALEYAHDRGVIHRDLKPANIKITPEGRVKVLDFGLAAVVQASTAEQGDAASSPTLTMRATIAGVIMGTAAYMSPEQAAGKAVDKRADIWSFGVVLWEMLTGQRLFSGETVSHTLADVLRAGIDLGKLPKDTPAAIRILLRRCLDRDIRKRLRDIGEARIILEEPMEEAAPAPAATITPRRRAMLPWILAALAAGVAAVIAWRAPRPVEQSPMWLSVDLGPEASPSRDMTAIISPDGSHIVFPVTTGGVTRLAVRYLSQPNATPLPGTETAVNPFFSPDGEWVAFGTSELKIKKVPIRGGSPVTLCDGGLRGGSWGEDGYIVAVLGNARGLSRIPEGGGPPQPLTTLENGEVTHRWPQVLPGGQAVLFSASATQASSWDQASVQVVWVKTGQKKVIQPGAYFGRYLPNGYLAYLRGSSLYGMPFDVGRMQPKGPPATLLEDVAASVFGGGQLDFSRNGTLVYLAGRAAQNKRQLSQIDGGGKSERLSAPAEPFSSLALSPDGKQLAVTLGLGGGGDLDVFDLQRGILTRLATAGAAYDPIWAPDGKHLVYSSADGNSGMMWIRADGSAEPQLLVKRTSPAPVFPLCIAPDGHRIYFARPQGEQRRFEFSGVAVDISDPDHPKPGEPETVLNQSVTSASISPDGRWLAYTAQNSGVPQIFVRPLGAGGKSREGLWQVSAGGGQHPLWSRAGGQLLFVSQDNHVMAVDYSVSGDSFQAKTPRLWTEKPIGTTNTGAGPFDRSYDLTADGKRIITWEPDEVRDRAKTNLHITVLTNWFGEVERRFAHAGH
jgi:serine/threonine-protein kinase